MKKYEEEHYRYENIRTCIYPWVKKELRDSRALNGKFLSEKDTAALAFAGELKIIFVIKRGEEAYEIIKDNMLPPDISAEELYHTACENLARDVDFVIGNTWYGAFAIIADGIHEASSLCFKHIWQVCVDKLKDDLIIMVPSKDTVLFAPASQEKAVQEMEEHAREAYSQARDKVSLARFSFSEARRELAACE